MTEIRHDIPIPAPELGKGTAAALRGLLKAGDSVWLPIAHNQLGPAANAAGLTGKYTARSIDGGLRIWQQRRSKRGLLGRRAGARYPIYAPQLSSLRGAKRRSNPC